MTFVEETPPELPYTDPNEVSKFYAEIINRRKQTRLDYERRCKMFEEIKDTELDSIIAGSRTRGIYKQELAEMNGAKGVRVSFESGVFKGKNPQSVAIGFRNAIEKNEEFAHLKVITVKDANDVQQVYIRNTAVEDTE